MTLGRSKLTAEGRTLGPAPVRKRLEVGPGSVLEWALHGDHVVLRRAGPPMSEVLQRAVFPDGPPVRRPLGVLRDGVRRHARERRARPRR
jgi:bifunctional DNA-binding transcriptional regulator/antitoxin component of YhaV-PrlF toxin-antitoxin module